MNLLQLIVQEAPGLIALIQKRHADANPGAPVLSPEQVVAGFEQAFTDSVAKDEMIKAALAVG